MPKPTFFNLSEEKKQKLIKAAKQEFSRAPLFEASISNIVKSASIPRGSFYQYFEDKEDAFFYILDEISNKTNLYFIVLLKKLDGDLFAAMIEFFKIIIDEKEHFSFFKNAFLNMTYKIENTFTKSFNEHEDNSRFTELQSLINKDKLNISSDSDLIHVINIITAVTFHNFVEKFAKDLTKQEALKNYLTEIQLIKKGLMK